MNNILEIKNLRKTYHNIQGETLAIDNINLNIKKGEFVAIVGPSGCGKSTLLSMIGNLDKEYQGTISYDKNIKIGYMLQVDCLFDWLTILDNCLLGLKISNKNEEYSKTKVKKLLKTYGLKDFINNYPTSLSGGMRQRVALIRTLAIEPDIILLDEPFSALDYQTRLVVSDDVYNIIKKENKTAIMITHDLGEAISIADRVIILTERPARIKKDIKIIFDKELKPTEKRRTNKFLEYSEILWKEFDLND